MKFFYQDVDADARGNSKVVFQLLEAKSSHITNY